MNKCFFTVLVFCIASGSFFAQNTDASINDEDGYVVPAKNDSIIPAKTKKKFKFKNILNDSIHSPTTAWIASAILPGAGQIYNKKYWHLPIIYGGLMASGYYFSINRTQFNRYKDAYITRVEAPDSVTIVDDFENVSDEGLRAIAENYRKNADFAGLAFFLIWALNSVDALVDAHFYHFDVSNDLSLKITPITYGPGTLGLSMNLQFK